jgi:hypothetical protein
MWVIAGRPGAEKPDHGHRGLLRARSKRPNCRRAAEKGDELAPLDHENSRPDRSANT